MEITKNVQFFNKMVSFLTILAVAEIWIKKTTVLPKLYKR